MDSDSTVNTIGEPPSVLESIVNQHSEETAFLWLLRDAAVRAPHYDLKDLAELDERVEAHIDGLRIAGGPGWDLCLEGLEHEERGEVFAAAVLALESRESERLNQVLALTANVPEAVSALTSAFGWVNPRKLTGTVKNLLASPSPYRRCTGIAACAVHRADPNKTLDAAIIDEDLALRARSLRAVGEIARKNLLPGLQGHFGSDDDNCRFWAAWSAVLVGDRAEALEILKTIGEASSPLRFRAMQVALRAMNPIDAGKWLKPLNDDPQSLRAVITGMGITGDPRYIPWLIKQMESPEVARVAGEAFTMITGVDLAYEDLEGEWPEGFEAGPTENPEDEDVEMDPDEDLPWPNPELVGKWWQTNKHRFEIGQRYLVGKPVSEQQCQWVLAHGYQRQRNAAALELKLMKPEEPLFETRAPGFRQQHLIRKLGWGA